MRWLSVVEVLRLHERVIAVSGGCPGVRDLGALESALAQPWAAFGGAELYPDLMAKAAALCYSLVMNHPFVDGNKRTGHAAMEVVLLLNGREIAADVTAQERTIRALAAGELTRDDFVEWLRGHVVSCSASDEV